MLPPYLISLIAMAAVSLVAFIAYGLDKRKAKKGQWRTKESVLLGLGLCGGAVGALLGMQAFRHKTKHWYFWYGLPAILTGQLMLCVWLIWRFLLR